MSLGVLVAVAGCGGAAERAIPELPPAPAVPQAGPPALGLHAGEAMQFEVTLGGILAGEALLVVGEPGVVDGHPAIAVRSRLQTVGAAALVKKVVDDATTVIDTSTRLPIQLATDVEYGDNRYTADITWHDAIVEVLWARKDHATTGRLRFDFHDHVAHDAHSAMAEIREWRAAAGARRTVWVVGGKKLWRADLVMGEAEVLGTRLGNRPTIRLDGVAYRVRADLRLDQSKKPRKFTVWVSDDADRVPLRVQAGTELGDVTIELTDYQRP